MSGRDLTAEDLQRRCALPPIRGHGEPCQIALVGAGHARRLMKIHADPQPGPLASRQAVGARLLAPEAALRLDGAPILLAPFIEGVTLSELLQLTVKSGRRLPMAIGLRILLDAGEALTAYQAVSGPHGAISPRAIHVGTDGVVRLAVPRLARRAAPSRRVGRRPELAYTAPEGLGGEPSSLAADVFSLGVVAWEILAGRRLFHGVDDQQVTRKIVVDPIPRLWHVAPAARLLDDVVRSALSRSPSGRYDSAGSMRVAVERATWGVLTPASVSDVAHALAALTAPRIALRSRSLASLFEDARHGEEPKVALDVDRARPSPREVPSLGLAVPPTARAGLPSLPQPIGWCRTRDGYAPRATSEAPSRQSSPRFATSTWLSGLLWLVAIFAGIVAGVAALRVAGVDRPLSAMPVANPDRADVITPPLSESPAALPSSTDSGTRVSLSDLPSAPARSQPAAGAAPPRRGVSPVRAIATPKPSPPPPAAILPVNGPAPPESDVPPNPYET